MSRNRLLINPLNPLIRCTKQKDIDYNTMYLGIQRISYGSVQLTKFVVLNSHPKISEQDLKPTIESGVFMYATTNLADASTNLVTLCDKVVDDREIVIINRHNGENVALIAADELESLMETAHLLSSPQNTIRLLTALQEANKKTLNPQTVEELWQDLGLDKTG